VVDGDAHALVDDRLSLDRNVLTTALDVNSTGGNDVLGGNRGRVLVDCGGEIVTTSSSKSASEKREGGLTLALGHPGWTVREGQARGGHTVIGRCDCGKGRDGDEGDDLG
jgi:hypothetical protein